MKPNPYAILTLSHFPDQLVALLQSLRQANGRHAPVYVVSDGLPAMTQRIWSFPHYLTGADPFTFAHNFNIGVAAIPRDHDIFFIGDDGRLDTPGGIAWLRTTAYKNSRYGIVSPGIRGAVGNPVQRAGVDTRLRELSEAPEPLRKLCFVAVYIKRPVLDAVGPIPEQLTGYGYEDDWFCYQARRSGFELVVDPGVTVEHGWGDYTGSASYQRRGLDKVEGCEKNRAIFEALIASDSCNAQREDLIKNDRRHIQS